MLDFITTQRMAFVLALSDLYRDAELVQAGARVSDGRGGFTGSTFTHGVKVHIEDNQQARLEHNIEPGQALIYVLNADADIRPSEGDTIAFDGQDYQVLSLTTDPVAVAWECVCARG